jgi:hypothetical protein
VTVGKPYRVRHHVQSVDVDVAVDEARMLNDQI